MVPNGSLLADDTISLLHHFAHFFAHYLRAVPVLSTVIAQIYFFGSRKFWFMSQLFFCGRKLAHTPHELVVRWKSDRLLLMLYWPRL